MKGKIAIDARWLVGGIGTYTRHLLMGLKSSTRGFRIRAITREEHKAEVETLCDQVSLLNVPIYSAREQWRVPRMVAGHDLLHVPHFNAPLLARVPLIITLHDVIHLSDSYYGRTYKSRFCARPVLHVITRRARHIITVSEYSKAQIVATLGVLPEKITTIHNGVHEDFGGISKSEAISRVSHVLGITPPYLLYVGNLKRHKNVSVLLRAFALLQKHSISQRLVIVGDDSAGKAQLLQECFELGIAAKTDFLPRVAAILLPALYAGADLFVMPSRLEGFGLPLLEAMASGTPVISSNAASLPEIGSDAVLYFTPDDPVQLSELITQTLHSEHLREELSKRGRLRARLFTWTESARKHIAVYKKVLGYCPRDEEPMTMQKECKSL